MIRFRDGGKTLGLVLTAILATSLPCRAAEAQPDYAAYKNGVYLRFLPDGEPGQAHVPKLLLGLGGGEARPAVMDTGSTGIVVSAGRIPGFADLSGRPGSLTYSSSGRVMRGRWVTVPVTLVGSNEAAVTTRPIPVLGVTAIECRPHARDCRPEDDPTGVSMVGIGFGREADSQADSTPDVNPLLNVEASGPVRRGYVVTRNGVHVGLTGRNTGGDFRFIKLDPFPGIAGEWSGLPFCASVAEAAPICGRALIDTGVTSMYLTLPPEAVGGRSLSDGTSLSFAFPSKDAAVAQYRVTVGDTGDPLAPATVHLNTTRPEPFVNTGVHLLNGFDVLYDADGGFYAFRAHAPD